MAMRKTHTNGTALGRHEMKSYESWVRYLRKVGNTGQLDRTAWGCDQVTETDLGFHRESNTTKVGRDAGGR